MKLLLGLICLLVGVALAKSCCFPDQISFDWDFRFNTTGQRGGRSHGGAKVKLAGSGAIDFKRQQAYIASTNPENKFKAILDLSQKPGFYMTAASYDFHGEMGSDCMHDTASGALGKPWQCVLDNKKYMTKADGFDGVYMLNIPGFMTGQINLIKDKCVPQFIDVVVTTSGPGGYASEFSKAIVVSNIVDTITDRSVFKNDCDDEPIFPSPITVPTPNELVEMILASMPRPDHGDEDGSDGDQGIVNEYGESDEAGVDEASETDEDGTASAEARDGIDGYRKRRCIIPGAFC